MTIIYDGYVRARDHYLAVFTEFKNQSKFLPSPITTDDVFEAEFGMELAWEEHKKVPS